MKVSVEAGTGLERRMTVEIPSDRIEKEIDSRLVRVGRSAKIKGFRPGKVPPKVLRDRYGLQVRQEVLQDMIQSSYSSAIQQESLRPASNPTIEPGNVQEGEDFSFTAIFEVYPEIQLEGLDSLSVEQPETEVTDADVDDMIDTLRRQRADWGAVERKSAEGDRVVVDFAGTLGGEPFEGGSGSDVAVVIGQGQMLGDFEDNLKGLAAGDETSFDMPFPQDYPMTELAGQTANFAVTVKEVAQQELPEVNEDFVKTFGIESGDMDAFRSDVRANMVREAESRNRAEIKRQIMEQLLDANPIEVPAALADQEAAGIRREAMQNMGITDEADLQAPPLGEFRDAAERRVRLGLIVSAVINEGALEVDRDLVKQRVDELVAPYDQPDEIRKMYFQNPQLLGQVENMVMEEQVVAWLVDKATVTMKPVKFADLIQAQ